jgi:ADP-ribose pyrophosphatase YjhB (NUDIX family)
MAVHRAAARLLPVSADDRVLLLQDQDPARPGVLRWGTIGGAVDPGESLVQAAVREMFEETGIVVEAGCLTGPVHQDSRPFSYDGVDYLGHSTFFAVPLAADTPVTFAHLEPIEVANVLAARWWGPHELAAAGGMIADDLPDIMRAGISAVRGGEA